MLRICEGSIADENLLSREGTHTQDDEDSYNGTTGEIKEKKLVLAPAQTTLAAGIDEDDEEIILTAPVFDDPSHPYIIVVSGANSETMKIIGGFGTNNLVVTRGDSPISASADDSVFNAYTYENITIQASGDETGWFRYAPDVAGSPGEYGASLSPPNCTNPKTYSYTFWREVTAPIIAAQRKGDTRHKTNFESFEYAA
ncbi:unnamed protein product [marine sediment metagenome]|uniref:Uncharacterized protein n=1 Tax=marine sediment metagenome TaxID=412755 RepID=X1LNV1_9ZZZZ